MYYTLRLVFILALLVFVPYMLASWYGFEKKRYFVLIFIAFTFACLYLMRLASQEGGDMLNTFYQFGMYWLGFFAFLLTMTVLYLIIGKLLPFSSKTGALLVVFSSILLCIYATYNAKSYKNYHVEIPIEGIEEELVIYHAPDVHLGAFAGVERSQKIVDDINKIKPDLVIFNGDFYDSKVALTKENLEPFKQTTIPMYFTIGNHDIYVGMNEIKPLLEEYGIKVLQNDIVEYKNVQILGLDYMNADETTKDPHSSIAKDTIKNFMPTLTFDKNRPLVVAHHKPIGIPYLAQAGADLVLAGHTHAGQLFPATLLARIQFDYLKGLYEYDDTKIYVSKGIGTFGPPMRLGAEAEATVIKLVPRVSF